MKWLTIRKGKIVVGPKKDELPPEPLWKEIEGNHEVIAIGSIFWQADEPKLHLHGAFGRGDHAFVGCLREAGEAFLILEAIVIEIEGIKAEREFDPATGLTLLKIGQGLP
ncbi:MAG: PPC domain-containing DNA-binding protein [Thermodesulfovibrionales bacterium]